MHFIYCGKLINDILGADLPELSPPWRGVSSFSSARVFVHNYCCCCTHTGAKLLSLQSILQDEVFGKAGLYRACTGMSDSTC